MRLVMKACKERGGGGRRKSKRSCNQEEKKQLRQFHSSRVQIWTTCLLPFCMFLMCVSLCVTHQEVLLAEHLPSHVVEGLPSQPATCTHKRKKEESIVNVTTLD